MYRAPTGTVGCSGRDGAVNGLRRKAGRAGAGATIVAWGCAINIGP